jgi:DNA polymerase-1
MRSMKELAMIAVDRWCEEEGRDDARLIMQVHDELVLEARTEVVDRVAEAVRGCMVAAGRGALRVPLKVDVGRGMNWDEAH